MRGEGISILAAMVLSIPAGVAFAGPGLGIPGLPQREDGSFFLQGSAPGDWLERQLRAPGWERDSLSRLRLGFEGRPSGDSCCGPASFSGAYQRAGTAADWGLLAELEEAELESRKSPSAADGASRQSGRIGAWMGRGGTHFKGASLALSHSEREEDASETERPGGFAAIHRFSGMKEMTEAASMALLISPAAGHSLLLNAGYSYSRMESDSGNRVTYDQEAFRHFDSEEVLTHMRDADGFSLDLEYFLALSGRSLLAVHAHAALLDGHGPETRITGDTSGFAAGASWMLRLGGGKVVYQASPGADIGMDFHNPAGRAPRTYLGFLKPFDRNFSRTRFSATIPQRIDVDLGRHWRLIWGWRAEYAFSSGRGMGEGRGRERTGRLGLSLDAPSLSYLAPAGLGISFSPRGTFQSPGGAVAADFRL